MALTAEQLSALEESLQRARYSGQRSVRIGEREITWASDAELAQKLADLRRERDELTASTPTMRTTFVGHSRG